MEFEVRARRLRVKGRTYEYLYVSIPKGLAEALDPRVAVVRVEGYPPAKLRIATRRDGRREIHIPPSLARYFGLRAGSRIDVELLP
jgi:hypothetical protein